MTSKQRYILDHAEAEGVPYIILPATDECAINALLKYFEGVQTLGCSGRYINEVNDKVNEFTAFRMNNLGKLRLPD
jgi:Uri superfamily endonuclease